MSKTLRVLGVFLSFVFALFGTLQMAMGIEILSKQVAPNEPTWLLHSLEFRNAQQFYVGCLVVAACLTFLWVQRCKAI